MISRKTPWVLAAAAGLTLGTFAIAQEAGGTGDQAAPSGQAGAAGGGGQAAPSGQPAEGAQSEQIQQRYNEILDRLAQDPQTAGDKLFLFMAALHNRAQYRLAEQVAEKTKNEQVKNLAQRTMDNVKKSQDQLRQAAQALGVEVPEQPIAVSQREIRVLSILPPEQLDKQYVAHVQADNARALSRCQAEAQIAQTPQVKQFAQQQIPWLREHTQMTNQTAQAVGITMGAEAQPAGGAIPGQPGQQQQQPGQEQQK